MTEAHVPVKMKSTEVSIVVHRANGTVEDLGVVSYWHKNPLKRWAWKISKTLSRLKGKF